MIMIITINYYYYYCERIEFLCKNIIIIFFIAITLISRNC